jgi:hypothetical protein
MSTDAWAMTEPLVLIEARNTSWVNAHSFHISTYPSATSHDHEGEVAKSGCTADLSNILAPFLSFYRGGSIAGRVDFFDSCAAHTGVGFIRVAGT